jgi:hypothetical protein
LLFAVNASDRQLAALRRAHEGIVKRARKLVTPS